MDVAKDAETFGIAGGVDPRQREALAPGETNLVIDSAVVPAACTQPLGWMRLAVSWVSSKRITKKQQLILVYFSGKPDNKQ